MKKKSHTCQIKKIQGRNYRPESYYTELYICSCCHRFVKHSEYLEHWNMTIIRIRDFVGGIRLRTLRRDHLE